jgi:Family of unknown function (DUF5685)
MFGLMRKAPRLAYCGTCKGLGRLYGQRARLLLNHDMVFLAELLMHYTGTPDWSQEHLSFNCFAIPKITPPALEYAATLTVLLAHFQIEDHRLDSQQLRWSLAQRALSPPYRLAAARLKAWEFPLDRLELVLATQIARELQPLSLAHVAEPTALATGMAFSHGAAICGRPELFDSLFNLGHRFGQLIYTLDAYEDRERDQLTGEFNPLLIFRDLDGRAEILAASQDVQRQLPPHLASRLRTNVERRLGPRQHAIAGLRGRWRGAIVQARKLRDLEQTGWLKAAAVLGSMSLLAFAFPHQTRLAVSWRHALGIGLNLMAFGALFAKVEIPKPDKSSGCASWLPDNCCDCCDGCDCCCECGSCDC